MHIHKPDDVMLGLAYHTLNGKPYVFLTIAYLCDQDQQIIDEQQAWPWLDSYKSEEPFDYGLKKARGTFGVIGSAYAPSGQVVKNMQVTAQFGPLTKKLAIHGNRHWEQGVGIKPSATQAFTSMPINLSNAFGGTNSDENIYGKGWPDNNTAIVGRPLPNIESIDNPILSPKDRPAVATFAVLSASSKARTNYMGTLNTAWLQKTAPWVPGDTDTKWFDLVPQDQCIDKYWQGNESWSVLGMHPKKSRINGKLPGLRPRLLVNQLDNAADANPNIFETKLDLDTVYLYPNEQRVLLMYRAAVAVSREDGADISNIAIFTEQQNQQPQTMAELIGQWDKINESNLVESPAIAATALAGSAIDSSDIIAKQEQINAEIAASLDETFTAGLQERNRIVNDAINGSPSLAGLDLPPPTKPDFAAIVAAVQLDSDAPKPNLATLQEDITRDVLQELEKGKQLARDEIQKVAQSNGLDPNDVSGLIDEKIDLSADIGDANKSAVEVIQNMSMPDELKSDLLGKAADFDAQMLSVDETIASVRKQIDNLHGSLPGAYVGIAGAFKAAEKINTDSVLEQIKDNPDLAGTELNNLDFSGQDLSGVVFTGAVIKGCNFANAVLIGANFKNALIENCDFSNANINENIWKSVDIKDSNFTAVQASQTDFSDSTVVNSQFDNSDLYKSNWSGANIGLASFKSANFVGAVLNTTTFWATDASNANFSHIQATGIRIDSDSKFTTVNFDQADLNNASLQDTDFSYAILNQANLNTAYIAKCNLDHTTAWQLQAKQASFKDSRITAANWTAANLMQANFEYAVLQNTNFSGANLYAAETRTANIENLLLQDALLSRSYLDPEFKKAAI